MQKQTRPEDGRKAACGNVAAARDKACLAANALRGLHAQLATIGYPSERCTGKTWLGGAQERTAELAPSSVRGGGGSRQDLREGGRRWRRGQGRRGWRRKRQKSGKRSCQQLNETLAWKHLQRVQVERIHHPHGRKMKKITVNSSQLGAVGGHLCHT